MKITQLEKALLGLGVALGIELCILIVLLAGLLLKGGTYG